MKRFLLFLALFWLTACDNSSDDVSLDDLKTLNSKANKDLLMAIQALVSEVYVSDKLGTIQEVVSSFKEDKDTANVTLIASQNVYNDDGTLKEIRTIELSIPNTTESSVISLNLKDMDTSSGFDSDDMDQLREARDTLQTLSMLGMDTDLIYAERDDSEEDLDVIVFSKNFMMLKTYDFTFINETIVMDSLDEVNKDYKKVIKNNLPILQPEILPTSVLMYDQNGKYLKEKSNVVPQIMSVIHSINGEVSFDILELSLKALSDAILESEDVDYKDVPENVRKTLIESYPDLIFIVTGESLTSAYVSKDFSIDLRYEFLDLQESLSYTIFGYNRTASH
ncbi:uncharacterized protein LOC126745326 [Anthonomus grandis grandis]|uniref:uncharacterized protein LOC126745326 n=1 Tax=Anthonomus grandis grandis TaxID=2921223 RepID=UPI0021656096|nr:uncharacterized protein LOC126745326 [Anthonomus grandis grandis]